MKKTLKTLKIIFFATFSEFILISGVILYLKKIQELQDFITLSSKLTMAIPIIMIISILASYFVYDRMAKKSKKVEDENSDYPIMLFKSASIIKIAMFNFVGVLSAVMMLLIYQKTYLYLIGIVAVFYLINFPSENKFRRDFIKRKQLFK